MAYALVAHAAAGSGNATTATTAGIDTTGASLLVAVVAQIGTGGTFSDSKGNTWTPLTIQGGSGFTRSVQIYYCIPTSVGPGHTITFTCGGSGAFPAATWAAFSGAAATPFDSESGAAGSNQPGSLTPSVANELLVTGLSHSDTTAESIDSGFTITDDVANAANNAGCSMAYLIETTAAAKNPSWTPGANGRTAMAAFKAAAGGGATVYPWWQYATQQVIGAP